MIRRLPLRPGSCAPPDRFKSVHVLVKQGPFRGKTGGSQYQIHLDSSEAEKYVQTLGHGLAWGPGQPIQRVSGCGRALKFLGQMPFFASFGRVPELSRSPGRQSMQNQYLCLFVRLGGHGRPQNARVVGPLRPTLRARQNPCHVLPPSTAAQVTGDDAMVLASAMTAAVAAGSALMVLARSIWARMESTIIEEDGFITDTSLSSRTSSSSQASGSYPLKSGYGGSRVLHGVDVSGSKYFGRRRVLRALDMAARAHEGQFRKTRQPYVTHCIETALIVEALLSPNEDDDRAEDAIISALLHDAIDDGGLAPDVIGTAFGDNVKSMVTKVSQLSATNQLVRRKLRLEGITGGRTGANDNVGGLDESASSAARKMKETEKQETEKLRTMIVTMVSEPLVIVIKLADRLHNMRTVYALAPDKQEAVATETRKIWCTLAERLGMFAIKSELEDLCFAVLEPSTYGALRGDQEELWGIGLSVWDASSALERFDEFGNSLDGPTWLGSLDAPLEGLGTQTNGSATVGFAHESGDDGVDSGGCGDPATSYLTEEQLEIKHLIDTVLPFDASTFNMDKIRMTPSARRGLEVLQRCAKVLLQELITEGVATNLEITVHGRVKSLYSSFKKMARKGVPLSEVYDIRALRVVVDDNNGQSEREAIEICYKVLPVVHRLWRRVPGEEDDYITVPKPSGYQSLHTAVIGPGGVPMEVQIRTSIMHEEAEYGKAAHWAYKERPVGTEANAAEIAPGHPVLRISGGGKLRDGVVVSVENGGNRLLVATSHAEKAFTSGSLISDRQVYEDLFAYVTERGYFSSSQGDMNVTLELYTMCSDKKYHQYDRFGRTRATRCVPLQLPAESRVEVNFETRSSSSASPAPPAASSQSSSSKEFTASNEKMTEDSERESMSSRIRLLRSMIEWGGDVIDESDQRSEIMVLAWPSGKILRMPNGTTAGDVFLGASDSSRASDPPSASTVTSAPVETGHQGVFLVNVNNRLVSSQTKLSDGDFVVVAVAKDDHSLSPLSRFEKVKV